MKSSSRLVLAVLVALIFSCVPLVVPEGLAQAS